MAKYESEKDKELYRTQTHLGGDVQIVAAVMSYDGGTPKVQLHREVVTKEGEYRFQKLGRLEPTAFHAVVSMLKSIEQANEEHGWWKDEDCKAVLIEEPN